ncbi:MAG TPA: hypothetical protein VI670_16235 [Thermoanaerobaculia bacterium]|jgi:hypothetical protein
MNADVRSASDVVAALIFLTNQDYLLADPLRLHRAVNVARSRCDLLQQFGFSPVGPESMSRSLDDALALLKLSRVLRMENTDYDRYIIDPAAKRYIETVILPQFSEQERTALTGAAAIVREECGSPA